MGRREEGNFPGCPTPLYSIWHVPIDCWIDELMSFVIGRDGDWIGLDLIGLEWRTLKMDD